MTAKPPALLKVSLHVSFVWFVSSVVAAELSRLSEPPGWEACSLPWDDRATRGATRKLWRATGWGERHVRELWDCWRGGNFAQCCTDDQETEAIFASGNATRRGAPSLRSRRSCMGESFRPALRRWIPFIAALLTLFAVCGSFAEGFRAGAGLLPSGVLRAARTTDV